MATDREVKSATVGKESVTTDFLSPEQQRKEDARKAEQDNLKPGNSLAGFFRIFRMTTEDR